MAKTNKADKKPLDKKTKKIIAVGVILLSIIAILSTCIIAINASENVDNKLALVLMPKSITDTENGTGITFYIEENKDYKLGEDEPINAWTVYYFDNDNTRHDLYGGIYKNKSASMQVTLGFLLKANEKLQVVKNVFTVIVVLLVIAVIVYLVYLWYLNWSKRQDEQKKLKYQNNKNSSNDDSN